jgi:hypothetical protein
MKSLSLRRNSWHYFWARKLGWEEYHYETRYNDSYGYPERVRVANDFCSYLRRIFFGSFLAIVAVVLCIFLGGSILYSTGLTTGYLLACLVNWQNISTVADDFLALGFVTYVVAGILGIGFSGKAFLIWLFNLELPNLRLPPCEKIPLCEDTKRFIVAAYTTFHDKVCFKLEFHNKQEENR